MSRRPSSLDHILRPLQDLQSLLSVNCLFLKDDPTKVFTVKIPKSDNVSVLKEMIKAKKAPHLDDLAASDLILYKVSLSSTEVDARLKEDNADSKAKSAVTRIPLPPMKKLKEVFPEPLREDIVHVLFERHSPGTCSCHR